MQMDLRQALERALDFDARCAGAARLVEKVSGEFSIGGSSERGLVHKVADLDSGFSVAAVDSGTINVTMRHMDVTAIKCASALFKYNAGKLVSNESLPSKSPRFEVFANSGLELGEAGSANSILRLNSEITLASRVAREKTPDLLLIDGSIVPLAIDRPAKDSRVYPLYQSLVSNYLSLFDECEKHGISLAGFSKDSRGRRFARALIDMNIPGMGQDDSNAGGPRGVLSSISDVGLFSKILSTHTRTCALPYASRAKTHPILADFGEFGNKINVFYQRIWQSGPVYRVEILSAQEKQAEMAGKISSMLDFMCKAGRKYPYPPVLIEADMRACASPNDAAILEMELARAGWERQVRNDRPFR